jgi:putative glutamine amidotransferase
MLNVHLGGTLHQHLPDVVNHNRYQVGDGVFHPELMSVVEGSLLHQILGDTEVQGHVYHHQAIDQVAPGLRITARGFDGTIQAIEMEDYPFGLAIQWHPEENLSDVRIFEGLIAHINRS